ncbi:hypothetical protein JCM3774_003524 [Rhodotorula dairenensis]
MGSSTPGTNKSTSPCSRRRPPRKSNHARKNKLKPNDPLPPGVTTKEQSCASCRIRKTRCTGGRPACVQCTKAAVAKGFAAVGVHCVYSAASVFATRDDVAFERQVGGRGARCIWDSSVPAPTPGSTATTTTTNVTTVTTVATASSTSPAASSVLVQPIAEESVGGLSLSAAGPEPEPADPSGAVLPLDSTTCEPLSELQPVSPLPPFTPDPPEFDDLFPGLTDVPTSLYSPIDLSFFLPPHPPPLLLPPAHFPPLLVPSAVSPPEPLGLFTRPSISSISSLSTAALPSVPTTPCLLRSPSPLSPSTPEDPLPSTADVAFWEWGPLSLGEVDAWPGLSYVATQSGITH